MLRELKIRVFFEIVFSLVQCDPEESMHVMLLAMEARWQKSVQETGGLESETDYSIKGCRWQMWCNANKIASKVTNFTNIPIDEDQMAT